MHGGLDYAVLTLSATPRGGRICHSRLEALVNAPIERFVPIPLLSLPSWEGSLSARPRYY